MLGICLIRQAMKRFHSAATPEYGFKGSQVWCSIDCCKELQKEAKESPPEDLPSPLCSIGKRSGLQIALIDSNPCTPIRCFFTKLFFRQSACGKPLRFDLLRGTFGQKGTHAADNASLHRYTDVDLHFDSFPSILTTGTSNRPILRGRRRVGRGR